ncbi:MAG: Crp/Fnr family transcriptional regulator [Halobacteriovoraceae bacterium]|jgi:CRP-like cAMP-binding protein|nr:Crp/Fnr family transcriptional regulator [Halobacteriovoraceae bacterium]
MTHIHSHIKDYLQSLVPNNISDWIALEEIFTLKKIKKGEHFFQHFDHCDEVGIVSSGLFRIYLIDHEGEEKTFSFIPEKSFILDFFLSWQENSKTMVSVQALEDSEVLAIKYSKFLELMNRDKLWHDIYREVLLRNYIFKTKREIQFVQFNAKQRLTMFMNNRRIDINRIPKTYLASYLGIQPPSLSRLLRDLKG